MGRVPEPVKKKAPQARPTRGELQRRSGLSDTEFWNWVRTGDIDGIGYTTQGIDYDQRTSTWTTRAPRKD